MYSHYFLLENGQNYPRKHSSLTSPQCQEKISDTKFRIKHFFQSKSTDSFPFSPQKHMLWVFICTYRGTSSEYIHRGSYTSGHFI